jgi:hypothetical protein
MGEKKEGKDLPLEAKVEAGVLVIRIGVDVQKQAFEESDENNPWDHDAHDNRRKFVILDAEGFAQDVVLAMNHEAENGATPLTDFLDRMMEAALEDGSVYVEEADEAAAAFAAGE